MSSHAKPLGSPPANFFGLTWDGALKASFGGNAWVAIIVLFLITISLFREAFDFFPRYQQELSRYRATGMELVDVATRPLKTFSDIPKELEPYGIRNLSLDFSIEQYRAQSERLRHEVRELLSSKRDQKQPTTDEVRSLLGSQVVLVQKKLSELELNLEKLELPKQLDAKIAHAMGEIRSTREGLNRWDPAKPFTWIETLGSFFFGTRWITNSSWQDQYGFLPLLTGSLLISCIAITLAVQLGVGSAIYVNQFASPREQTVLKPAIEFIAAFPSVVLGFFGVMVLGEMLRNASEWSALSWLPFFPMKERLNAATAGLLLAFMATPTIFSLSEDALNNVPRSYREASLALGASRVHTSFLVMLPAALPGIVSAVLLGFGRVIGETMVVLMCAGGMLSIPDISQGIGVVFEPVHTLTGIIAQEMPEVAKGSLHYRALFMVAIVLFFITLLLNFTAQRLLLRANIIRA